MAYQGQKGVVTGDYMSTDFKNPGRISYNPERDGKLRAPINNASNSGSDMFWGRDGTWQQKAPEAGFNWKPSKGGKSRRYRKSIRKSNQKSKRRR
jgi:hypothetical protein